MGFILSMRLMASAEPIKLTQIIDHVSLSLSHTHTYTHISFRRLCSLAFSLFIVPIKKKCVRPLKD